MRNKLLSNGRELDNNLLNNQNYIISEKVKKKVLSMYISKNILNISLSYLQIINSVIFLLILIIYYIFISKYLFITRTHIDKGFILQIIFLYLFPLIGVKTILNFKRKNINSFNELLFFNEVSLFRSVVTYIIYIIFISALISILDLILENKIITILIAILGCIFIFLPLFLTTDIGKNIESLGFVKNSINIIFRINIINIILSPFIFIFFGITYFIIFISTKTSNYSLIKLNFKKENNFKINFLNYKISLKKIINLN